MGQIDCGLWANQWPAMSVGNQWSAMMFLLSLVFLGLNAEKLETVALQKDVKVFSTVHESAVLGEWPSDTIKYLAGSKAWGGWKPKEGMEGKVLKRWDEHKMVLLEVEGRYCVVSTESVPFQAGMSDEEKGSDRDSFFRKEFKESFDRVDKDQSGFIELGELSDPLKFAVDELKGETEIDKSISLEQKAQQRLAFYDLDGDGKISFDEHFAEHGNLFKVLDKDRDNKISQNEMVAMLMDRWSYCKAKRDIESQVTDNFAQGDSNANGFLDWAEFSESKGLSDPGSKEEL
jgi:Ca2+-binding EF-hand superfamily protein